MKKNYFLKSLLILMISITSSTLFGQTYTFTNAGVTGQFGPTQPQVDAAYGAGVVTINTQGIQEWTVPATGNYSIQGFGGQGGKSFTTADSYRGAGANIMGEFSLTAGQVLKIVVGQEGTENTSGNLANGGGCGGGGSFVWINGQFTPLIVAGGGGGGSIINTGGSLLFCEGKGAPVTNDGLTSNSGVANNGVGGGDGTQGPQPAKGWTTMFGLLDFTGRNNAGYNGFGGFGGGGLCVDGSHAGGGAGGYSAGGNGEYAFNSGTGNSDGRNGGGGGGSFNSGINQVNVAGANAGMGSVVITLLEPTPIPLGDTPADIVENTGLTNIDVLANDNFGADGPGLVDLIVTPILGTVGSAILNNGGTPNVQTDDSIDFIPAFGYSGPVSISYTLTDGNGSTASATVTFNVLAGAPIVCGPINTLYQTVGNTTPGKTDIFRYNNFQQSYVKVGELGGTATGSSAPNSAYSAATQYVYSNEPSDGGSVLRVYDPAASYSYVGSITITGNSVNFNNTLFAQGNFIGYVNNNRVVRFDVTNIAAYPATVAVNEVTIAGASGANDFTLIGDEIYGVRNSTLRIINLTTNTLLDRTITFDESLDGVPNDGSFGAAWQDRNGNFYCFNNGNGGIYKITDVVNPASTIAVKVLLANPSGQNDGFGCELGPDPLDWDEDGISNNIDIDDDNDGILDVNESAGTGLDPGGDADADGVFNFRDVDIAGYVDVNGDTVNDNFDFDLDGIPDAYDLDSDNDGIPDNIEAQPTTGYVAPSNSDGDSDGLDDAYDTDAVGGFAVSPPNTDGTGNPDFLDVDADDDGSYDTVEAGLVLANADIDFDGLDDAIDTDLTNPTDSNGTIDNPLTDLQDTYGSVERDYRETSDLDADGVDDVTDLDDDNDGILDTVEYPATLEPFGDEDGDGIYNYADAIDNGTGDGSLTDYTNTNADVIPDAYDFDLDGIVNHLDTDSDNDGCSDANEAYGSSTADAGDGMQFGTGDPLTLGESEVNANGTVVSAGYTLPVNLDASLGDTDFDYLQLSILPTIITLDPIDVTILTFSNVSFTSTAATSGTGTIEHYQWQVQVNGGITWADIVNDGVIYSGANTTTLDITILNNALDGNNYRLVISSPAFVCDTDVISAAALLTISQNDILAINDNGSGIEGTASTAVANILANDDLAGATPTTGTVILTEVSSTSVNVTLNTATGAVDVSAAATAGTYSIVYQICETANPTNCTTGEVTVTIADLGNPTAVDDNISITEDTTIATVISALSNDSLIDGASYSSGSFIYTGANGAIIVDNGDGTFDYTPAATFSGLDSFSYTICDNDIPVASCSTATVFVTVLDEGTPFSVNDIANTILNTTVITGNVLTNDTVIDNATITSF
ncbi:beta strand repeat-containing protein, partial [Lutibacter sp.]|uniref:beta strand repeat-containing protein n=1 Tax=Lutibacter sp. TaxID=1925666 RepID=UPI003565DEF5